MSFFSSDLSQETRNYKRIIYRRSVEAERSVKIICLYLLQDQSTD
jgi:hypothetical protein